MITTKAYVTELPTEDSNMYKVNVPLMTDNVNDEAIFDAILSNSPGIYKGYKVGDCVIVTFEDDKYNIAIIQGKLFTDVPEESDPVYAQFDQLNVTGSVVLPENTKIGQYSPQDIYNLYQGLENFDHGIDPDELKPFVKWNHTPKYDESETDDDPAQKDYQISAEGVRLDHVHWEAPGVEKNEDGEYVDSEGNVKVPLATQMNMYAEDVNMQVVQYDAIGDAPEYGQPDTRTYANRIIIMSGEEYDQLSEKDEHKLYFLTSVPPSEIV